MDGLSADGGMQGGGTHRYGKRPAESTGRKVFWYVCIPSDGLTRAGPSEDSTVKASLSTKRSRNDTPAVGWKQW